MSAELLHIARGGVEIGAFPVEEVRSRLAAEELRPGDHYWKPGMAAWQALSALPPLVRVLPFFRPSEKSAGFFDNILSRKSYNTGLVAVWDKLAEAPVECIITESEWAELDAKVGFGIRERCRKDLVGWYRKAIEAYLSDRYFAAEEKTNLGNLARSFGLDAQEVESIHGEAFSSYCRVGMLTALLRDVSPEQKREQIDLLGKEVPLSEAKVKEIMGEAFQAYFNERIKAMMQKKEGCEVMDPSAYAAFLSDVKRMDVTPVPDANAQKRFDSAQRLWALLRTPLHEVPCALDLGSEGCFWTRQVELGLNRRVTTRRSYGGFGTSVKIWGPIRYRSGSYAVERQTEQRLEKVDDGTAVFTSKRVIFTGSAKSLNFKLAKILNVDVYSDAIEIDKDSGGSVVFFFPDGHAEAAVILRRLVKQAKG